MHINSPYNSELSLMKLQAIPKVENLSRESFSQNYLNPLLPVVFKDLAKHWPATARWNFEYFSKYYGDIMVPVYDPSFSKAGKTYMKPTGTIRLSEYLEIIQSNPSQLRIFLWNILKQVPELNDHILIPDIMDGFYKEFPFMFFGGQGSYTKIHYDVDCSHVFLTQFQTRKKIILFSPNQSRNLGHIPFTVGCLVDMLHPDEEKFPSIKHLVGWETTLQHGETLFIPSMYWHHIEYIDPGFSVSLRAANSVHQKVKGITHLVKHVAVDRGLNFIFGDQWGAFKLGLARKKLHNF